MLEAINPHDSEISSMVNIFMITSVHLSNLKPHTVFCDDLAKNHKCNSNYAHALSCFNQRSTFYAAIQ